MDDARCDYSSEHAATESKLTSNPQSRQIAESLSLAGAIVNVVDQTNKLMHVDVASGVVNVIDVDIAEAFPAKSSWLLLIDRGTLLVCGGLEREAKHTVLGVHISSCIGFPLSPLSEARGEAGIIHALGKVYLFGGRNPNLLQSCECFDLETNVWERIGDLAHPRACMTPVLWKSSILVVGGVGGHTMEVVSLPSHQFHSVPLQLPYSDQLTVAVVAGEQLVVIQRDQVVGTSLRGANRTVYPIAQLEKPGYWFSPTEAVCIGEKVYFLDWACQAAIWQWHVTDQRLTIAVRLG